MLSHVSHLFNASRMLTTITKVTALACLMVACSAGSLRGHPTKINETTSYVCEAVKAEGPGGNIDIECISRDLYCTNSSAGGDGRDILCNITHLTVENGKSWGTKGSASCRFGIIDDACILSVPSTAVDTPSSFTHVSVASTSASTSVTLCMSKLFEGKPFTQAFGSLDRDTSKCKVKAQKCASAGGAPCHDVYGGFGF